MITIKDVKKSFDERVVLDGVSMTLEKGTVTAILGRSGSGKSTETSLSLFCAKQKIFAKEGGESMLKEYLKLFGDFTKTALSVSKICRYLQRYWIPANVTKQVSSIEVREIYPVRHTKRFFALRAAKIFL